MREFVYNCRVYFSDTDAGGIVYHAKYLDFAEHARTESLREISNLSQSEMLDKFNFGFVVKSIKIEYMAPSYVDDWLTIKTEVKEMKKFSAVFFQSIYRDQVLLSTVETKVGCIDLNTKKPIIIPHEIEMGFSQSV